MIAQVLQILTNHGQSLTQQIKANTPKVTGKTAESVGYEVRATASESTLMITAKPFFRVVETGRGPTRPDYQRGEKTLVEAIKEWLSAKGLEQGLAYAIAKSIHKKGTKLYQQGGRKDVFSNVITDKVIANMERQLLDAIAEFHLRDFMENLKKNQLIK